MKKFILIILLSLIIESVAIIGISTIFGYYGYTTLYTFLLYVVPILNIIDIIGPKIQIISELEKVSIFVLLFLINSIKWMMFILIFNKGHHKIAIILSIPFIVAIFIYFRFII